MQTNAVIFDIGNVLVNWDPRLLYQKLIDDPDQLNWFLREVVTLEWHSHHDAGRPFAEGVALLSAQYPDYAELIGAFDHRWDETIGEVIAGTVEIVHALAAQDIPLFGLTNFSAEKFPAFRAANAFINLMDDVIVSGEEGLIKPDSRIFELAKRRFGTDPTATLFVDDRIDNVQAAQAAGYQGHLFKSADRLRQDLEGRGLL